MACTVHSVTTDHTFTALVTALGLAHVRWRDVKIFVTLDTTVIELALGSSLLPSLTRLQVRERVIYLTF